MVVDNKLGQKQEKCQFYLDSAQGKNFFWRKIEKISFNSLLIKIQKFLKFRKK